jgi:2'-5' RNA ligase
VREDGAVSDRDPVRLFLALWPEAPLRATLAAYRDAWRWPAGAKPVTDATLHLTLHFIGAFARTRVPALSASLAAVPVEEMVVRPADAEVWKGGIAVLRVRGEAALPWLHDRLGDVLADAGIALDLRPFAPHVALARKAAKAEPPGKKPAFEWRADGFALVESLPGRSACYEVLQRFGPVPQARSDFDSG